MKKLITIILALFSIIVHAQKVRVEKMNGAIVVPSIEKKEVPNALDKLPDGRYKIIELKGFKVDGKIKFKVCIFIKKTRTNQIDL